MLGEEIKKHMDTSVRDLANLAVNYRKQKFLLHLFAIKLSTLSTSYRECVICVLLSIDYKDGEKEIIVCGHYVISLWGDSEINLFYI